MPEILFRLSDFFFSMLKKYEKRGMCISCFQINMPSHKLTYSS